MSNEQPVAWKTPYFESTRSGDLTPICVWGERHEDDWKPLYPASALDAAFRRGLERAAEPAARDVLAERERQKTGEGWTAEHDDKHDHEELACAAACYAAPSFIRNIPFSHGDNVLDRLWPWDRSWWKPSLGKGGRRRSLVKAGALILAEIERLDRAAAIRALAEEPERNNNAHRT